jgi:WD40 repeat protein
MDIATHGCDHVLAASLITGHVVLHRYNPGAVSTQTVAPHPDSARCVQFANGGRILFSASVHRDIAATDVSTGAVVARISDAHASGVNALHILNENCVISGDDDGQIKVWDVRTGASVMDVSSHEDFISSFAVGPDGDTILSGSGDGMLGVHSMRSGKLLAMSDNMEAEVLSLCLLKGGRKVAAGLQDGVIAIFSWGDWGDCTDRSRRSCRPALFRSHLRASIRFPGHPESIDALIAVNSNMACTGSSDGLVRLINVHPNTLVGVLGEHGDFPVERLSMCPPFGNRLPQPSSP